MLHTGDPARATWQMLDAAGGRDLPHFTDWRRPRWCDALAEAAAQLQDHDAVEHWARLAQASVERIASTGRRGFALRARMRAQASRGDTRQALLSAQDAIEEFSAAGERIELIRTLIAAAAPAVDADDTDSASGWLERAAYLADRCRSARLAADVAAVAIRRASAWGDRCGCVRVHVGGNALMPQRVSRTPSHRIRYPQPSWLTPS